MNQNQNNDQRTPEPMCCCCGVRMGLGILYSLVLIGAVINFATAGSGSSAALPIVQGLLNLLSGVVGLASIFNPKVKTAALAMYIYCGLQAVSIVVSIIVIVISISPASLDVVRDQVKSGNPNYTDSQVQSVVDFYKNYFISVGIITIGITLIFIGLIVNRMLAYKNWLATFEESNNTELVNKV